MREENTACSQNFNVTMMVTMLRRPKHCLAALIAAFALCYKANAFVAVRDAQSLTVRSRTFVHQSPRLPPPVNDAGPTAPSSSTTALCGMWSQDDELQGVDRIKACIPYILPLLDGDQFGQFIYSRIPPLGFLNDLFLGPLVNIYHQIPFFGVGLFILLTLGTRFNTDMNRNVRFSAQQAALIDVALIFPELIASGFEEDPLPRYITEPCSNFVWYAYMSLVVYSIYCNLRGKRPDQIPFISGSADLMVGPF